MSQKKEQVLAEATRRITSSAALRQRLGDRITVSCHAARQRPPVQTAAFRSAPGAARHILLPRAGAVASVAVITVPERQRPHDAED